MEIDDLSKRLLAVALKLEEKFPGIITENWLNPSIVESIKKEFETTDFKTIYRVFCTLLDREENENRKIFLKKFGHAINYQHTSEFSNLNDYSKNVFDFEILEPEEDEINKINEKILRLEGDLGISRFEVIESLKINENELLKFFKDQVEEALKTLQKNHGNLYIKGILDLEVVKEAPWSAFNSHVKPQTSKISLNLSSELTTYDIKHMAYHEIYYGHHTELSLKDNLLLKNGWGEHGFILSNSPRTFISEGIAELGFELNKNFSKEEDLMDKYSNLFLILQQKAAFLRFDHNMSKDDITEYLKGYKLAKTGVKNIINFVFDDVFGRYSIIYHSAKKEFVRRLDEAKDKDLFLKEIYTTPYIL